MNPASVENGTMLEQYKDCVIEAAQNVFQITCGAEVQVVEEAAESNEPLIVAIISLVGDLEWSVFLGLPSGTAVAMAEQFAGFPIPFDSPDMGDAIGELTNILAGETKAVLDRRGVRVEISLPTVLRAENLEVLVQRNSSAYKTCYNSPFGTLWTGVAAGRGEGFVA